MRARRAGSAPAGIMVLHVEDEFSTYETCMTARPHPSGAEDFSEPGLNASANLGAYIRLLSDPSSTGVLRAPLFQGGFELRCLQLLSAAAWLLSLPGRTAD